MKRCAALNERLWSPSDSAFVAGLNSSLSYNAFLEGTKSKKRYWVRSPSSPSRCNAITTNGSVVIEPCNAKFPTLCTQSAPNSQAGEADTSARYQIIVTTGQQRISGFRNFHTFRFNGIRFAPKPKRFEFSTLYEGFVAVDATQYGPSCIQALKTRWPMVSEDCLFLNIWTPYLPSKSHGSDSRSKEKLKAVMVWIHGGGFIEGTGTDHEKEGGNLASRGDVVVVTFNYRVGNLGFLPLNDGVHHGNYGISDMLTALRWVKQHIADFGGDPDQVTSWGESAGAAGVRALLSAPSAREFIAGAILQSAPGDFGSQKVQAYYKTPGEVYETTTKKVLEEIGCEGVDDELACLRVYDGMELNMPERTRAQYVTLIPHHKVSTDNFHRWPIRDGKLLPYRGLPISGPLAYRHNIPLLIGTTRDEAAYLFPVNSKNFTQMMEMVSGPLAVNMHPLANSSFAPDRSPNWATLTEVQKAAAVHKATGHVVTAAIFTCPSIAFAYSAAKHQVFEPVYQFVFNRTYQPDRPEEPASPLCGRDVDAPENTEYYKCHAADVPFTFGNILQQGWRDRDGLDTAFARLVVDYWSAFARTDTMMPEMGYLEARGWLESKRKMEETGGWKTSENGAMMLQWGGLRMVSLSSEEEGCRELGVAKDEFEDVNFDAESWKMT